MSNENSEILMRMYEEQVRHARHHENMRSQSTNLIIAISAALIAFVAQASDSNEKYELLIGACIVLINLYGLFMSLKHYERNRLHVSVAAKYRTWLSKNYPVADLKINELRRDGKKAHYSKYKVLKEIRLHVLWLGLHVLLMLLGFAVMFAV